MTVKKFSMADSVASEMNSVMSSDDFRSIFAKPQVKTAQQHPVIEVPETVITEKPPVGSHFVPPPAPKPTGVTLPEVEIHAAPPADVAHADCDMDDDMSDDDDMGMAMDVQACIELSLKLADKIEALGFDKTASLNLITLETLISEAAKKKDKKDKDKKDKKEKGKGKFPFFMKKKDKKDADEEDDDDKSDKKDKKKDKAKEKK